MKGDIRFANKKWYFSKGKSHFWGIGSPSWTVLELFAVKRQTLETIFSKEKGHILIEYGLCCVWLPIVDEIRAFCSLSAKPGADFG